MTATLAGATPAQIWGGFYQSVASNCVTVSAIKAAMIRFWQDPQGIYQHIRLAADAVEVVMRDGFKLQVAHDEVRLAAEASTLRGDDVQLLNYANFVYAVSAKRAQLESNDFRVRKSYALALQTLSDGEHPGVAIRRLGLFGLMHESTVEELVRGAIGTLADARHPAAVNDGAPALARPAQEFPSTRWRSAGLHTSKLV